MNLIFVLRILLCFVHVILRLCGDCKGFSESSVAVTFCSLKALAVDIARDVRSTVPLDANHYPLSNLFEMQPLGPSLVCPHTRSVTVRQPAIYTAQIPSTKYPCIAPFSCHLCLITNPPFHHPLRHSIPHFLSSSTLTFFTSLTSSPPSPPQSPTDPSPSSPPSPPCDPP